MHLIIGGAYMGKLTFAKEYYGFADDRICDCATEKMDFSCPCITHVEEFVLDCVRRGEDPVEYFRSHREQWENSVLICRDISGGIVPMDPQHRQWRARTGHLCQYLSREADRVSRIFCGLEQRLK